MKEKSLYTYVDNKRKTTNVTSDALNARHFAFGRPCRSPSVLLSELHASDRTVDDSGGEQYRPEASDDGTDGEDQNIETWHDEWRPRGDDKRLDWGLDLGFGWCDLCGEDAGDESCFVGREGRVNTLSRGFLPGKCYGWDEDLL